MAKKDYYYLVAGGQYGNSEWEDFNEYHSYQEACYVAKTMLKKDKTNNSFASVTKQSYSDESKYNTQTIYEYNNGKIKRTLYRY